MIILFVIDELDFADHISISYLSAVSKQIGWSTYFIYLSGEGSSDLISKIFEIKPDVVAYSVNVMSFEKIIKEHKKAKLVHQFISIMGGPQATFAPETFEESGVDCYCIGEGEYVLRDFLKAVEQRDTFDDIPNIITRDIEGNIKVNPVRHLLTEEELNNMPMPDRDLTISNSFLKNTSKKTFYTTRGCWYNCAYCLPKGTLVLTEDLRYVPIENIKIGDIIIGINEDTGPAGHAKFCSSKVLNTFRRTAKIYEIKTMNGRVRSTEEHPWLTDRKGWWKKTKNFKPGQFLRRVSLPIKTPFETKDYKIGYIAGAYDGDGSIIHRKVYNPWGTYDGQQAKLVGDYEMMDTVLKYSNELEIGLYEAKYNSGKVKYALDTCITSYTKDIVDYIEKLMKIDGNDEYKRGYLAGIYDAEGNWSINYETDVACSLRIYNSDTKILEKTERYLNHFGFKTTIDIDKSRENHNAIRLLGNIDQYINFMSLVNPKTENKKQGIFYHGLYDSYSMITGIIPGNKLRDVYNLETSTQNFIADGFVTHNCCNNIYNHMFKGKGKIVRRFNVERVLKEIENVKSKYRCDFVKFGDDLFAFKADEWLIEFAEKYPSRIGIPFNCVLRFDVLNDEILRLLKKAGCYSVTLSVDSISSYIRENILKRRMKKDIDVASQLKKIRSFGIKTFVNFMLAVPESTLEDDINTIKLAREGDITYTGYTMTVPIKGTELYKYCIERGIIDPKTYKGDTSFFEKSILPCFIDKEKDIRFNILLLGAIVSKLPWEFYNIGIWTIKNIHPNILFRYIYEHYKRYSYENEIFKLKN